jgi:hypothetical protein
LSIAQQLVDMVKAVVALEIASTSTSNPVEESEAAKPDASGDTQIEKVIIQASKLEYKTVNEV